MKRYLGTPTFDLAIERMIRLYAEGHEIVVSFSGGKDSTVALEVCVCAAAETNRLPVKVAMRDEEVMFPGTFEYCERVAARPEVEFHWMLARQPVINVFNREQPYFWCFDPLVDPDEWVRVPPDIAYDIPEKAIQGLIHPGRFKPLPSLDLFTVTGLRAAESPNRIRGIHSAGTYVTKPNSWGSRKAHPVYDWADGDVWKAIADNHWDYNRAYDVMTRQAVARRNQRIAPPTQRAAQLPVLGIAARAYPHWFDRVCARLPGVRTAVQFGRIALEPRRKPGELWSATFQRECIDEAPEWIADRCEQALKDILYKHRSHSSQPFPEARQCVRCGVIGSYMRMAKDLYLGDAFSFVWPGLKPMEPSFFREGAGKWMDGASERAREASPSW